MIERGSGSRHSDEMRERALDLLVIRAGGVLSNEERAELNELLLRFPDLNDDGIELAAAAMDLALNPVRMEAAPRDVREAVARRLAAASSAVDRALEGGGRRSERPAVQRHAGWNRFGWYAAAACLVLAAYFGLTRGPRGAERVDPERGLQSMLAHASDVKSAEWQPWDSPEVQGVRGKVYWSESLQTGYMTFTNLPVNDPRAQQYQLWIIDERGIETRISGGVFDGQGDQSELVVEIEPAIAIRGAKAFAVTIEKPGGVWVSDMTRRVVIAPLAG